MSLGHLAALLTTVATLLVGHQTPVYCHSPGYQPWGDAAGWTVYGFPGQPSKVYLRYCGGTAKLVRIDGDIFAHELIHVEHPNWRHPKVYALEDWYWTHVVRAKLYSVEKAGLTTTKKQNGRSSSTWHHTYP